MASLRIAATLAYPLAIYLGLRWAAPRTLAIIIAALLLLRLAAAHKSAPSETRRLFLLGIPIVLILGLAALFQDGRYFLFVPSLISFAILVSFGRSLLERYGPPMVETFARIQDPDLPDNEVPYCRRLTGVWCVFLAANTLTALGFALFGSIEAWALYTGLLAYLLMGSLFAGEYVYRAWKFRRYQKSPFAPIFRRLFRSNPIP